MIKLENHDQDFDRRSLKHEDTDKIENGYVTRKEIDDDGSIDEALLSDADEMESFYEEGEDGEDFATLLGMLALLLTLFGHSSVGVISNMVPTSDGFVQQAQRSGIVVLVTAVPAFFEYKNIKEEVDWKPIFTFQYIRYSLATSFMQMMWVVMFLDAVQRTTQIHAYILNNLYPSVIVLLNLILSN